MPRFAMHSPMREWTKNDLPADPFVHLEAATYSSSDDRLFLSSQLMTDQEIDHAVDSLIGELEDFRKTAKRELKDVRATILQGIIRERSGPRP